MALELWKEKAIISVSRFESFETEQTSRDSWIPGLIRRSHCNIEQSRAQCRWTLSGLLQLSVIMARRRDPRCTVIMLLPPPLGLCRCRSHRTGTKYGQSNQGFGRWHRSSHVRPHGVNEVSLDWSSKSRRFQGVSVAISPLKAGERARGSPRPRPRPRCRPRLNGPCGRVPEHSVPSS
jgi:hypothetical protein